MVKNYLFYDKNYLGPGYFVVHKEDQRIISFFKFYKVDSGGGFPVFNFRAFSIDGIDNPDKDFTNIEFVFNKEDEENGLYEIFLYLSKAINKELITIDRFHQGNNYLRFCQGKEIVKIIASKDIWNADHYNDFIDIVLGDDMTCQFYYELSLAYNKLGELNVSTMNEEQMSKILSLKINRR